MDPKDQTFKSSIDGANNGCSVKKMIELADGEFTSRESATLVTVKRCDFWFAQYRSELVVSF
jgi:hypothetical protein